MAFEYQHQPYRTLYLTWQYIAIPCFHAPKWLISAIRVRLSTNTPKGSWTIGRHIYSGFLRQMGYISYKTGFGAASVLPTLSDEPGSPGFWIPAVPADKIFGSVKERAASLGIKPIDIPGYWIHESDEIPINEPAAPGEKVMLFLHGGGYATNTAHPSDMTAEIPRTFVRDCSSLRRSLSVEYRLSTSAPLRIANQFPTALLDAFAGYLHLVNLGFKENNIILVGDSAGGNLALALVRYLVDHQSSGTPSSPGSLILLSPWTDVGESFRANDDPNSSQSRFANSDLLGVLNQAHVRYFAEAFVGTAPGDIEEAFGNAYISPASPRLLGQTPSARTVSFKGFPRTWIDVGGFESLLDQIRRLKDAMVEDLGEELVRYNEVDGTPHDYTAFTWVEPERSETLGKITSWIDDA